MKLSDALCDVCLVGTWDFDKYDDYGDVIKPELCSPPPVITTTYYDYPVQEFRYYNTIDESLSKTFQEKNKLYCNK